MAPPKKKKAAKKTSKGKAKSKAKTSKKKAAKRAAPAGTAKKKSKKSARKPAREILPAEPEIWQIDGEAENLDRDVRGHYLIPCLLNDLDTEVYIKAVIIDLSATGCRIFTNDRRIRLMDRSRLMGRVFDFEFDFKDVDTLGIEATVRHVRPGKDLLFERQLGLEFTAIRPEICKQIAEHVRADVARHKA